MIQKYPGICIIYKFNIKNSNQINYSLYRYIYNNFIKKH